MTSVILAFERIKKENKLLIKERNYYKKQYEKLLARKKMKPKHKCKKCTDFVKWCTDEAEWYTDKAKEYAEKCRCEK